MSQNPSPVKHEATSVASSPSSPRHLPNVLPRGVDAEEVQQSPYRLVAEQQPPLDVSDSEEVVEPNDEDDDEYIHVDLKEIRECVECPICLGIIKNTRVIAECLHRFCKDCIEKALRIGKNECPICHTPCPSRRSLKADPKYDTIISGLFPDIEKFEEKEMRFLEEETIRNQQITAAIAEIARRQSERHSSR